MAPNPAKDLRSLDLSSPAGSFIHAINLSSEPEPAKPVQRFSGWGTGGVGDGGEGGWSG